MEKEPLISVIIPVYNGEKYIRPCIENILNQSYKNLEIIVVNDGSSDQSGIIAQEYPIQVIHLGQNRGLSTARNVGIDTAKGLYIHFMDVDDSINPDYYREMAKAVKKTDADIACGGMWNERFSYKSQRFRKTKVYTSTHDKLKATYVGKWGYVWRYLFKVDFLKKHNLRFEEGRLVEDLIFSFHAVYYADKLVVVPNTIYFYYNWENSISTIREKAHREKYRRDWLHARSYILNFADEHNFKIPGINSDKISYIWRKYISRHF
ncbi:CDP-glycerol glycerophosphotransferase [Porphyromonadaceae bacterium NLAE-zl-C104]|nr:CDP-glycerol glycerophosphotransferase [Porphyromonadaceae bacterium NLAE-zl-C104]